MGGKSERRSRKHGSELDQQAGEELLAEAWRRGQEQAYALVAMADDVILERGGEPVNYDAAGLREAFMVVLTAFVEGLATRTINLTPLTSEDVKKALEAASTLLPTGESLEADDEGTEDVTHDELDDVAANAKSSGKHQMADRGGVLWAMQPNGDVGLGFLTPDQYGDRRDSADGDALSALYAHWYLDHLGPALRMAASWVSVRRAKGLPAHLFMFDEAVATDTPDVLKALDTVYAEPSNHGVVASGAPARAVGAPILIEDEEGLTAYVGTVVAFENSEGEVVEQANVFAFPFNEFGIETSVAELSQALAERLASAHSVPIVMMDPQPLTICPECRQLACFGSTKQPEHAAAGLQ